MGNLLSQDSYGAFWLTVRTFVRGQNGGYFLRRWLFLITRDPTCKFNRYKKDCTKTSVAFDCKILETIKTSQPICAFLLENRFLTCIRVYILHLWPLRILKGLQLDFFYINCVFWDGLRRFKRQEIVDDSWIDRWKTLHFLFDIFSLT